MSIPGSVNPLFLGAAGQATGEDGYQVERSLRFNSSDSAYLSRTPAVAGNQQTFSISFWAKLASIGSFTFISSSSGNIRIGTSTNNVLAYDITPVSGSRIIRNTTAVLRDPSAWYHILFSVNTTSATQEHRFRVYVNGVEVLFDVLDLGSGYLPPNSTIPFNNTSLHEIGRRVADNDTYFNGYLADIHFIDGQALDPSSFTEVSATTGQLVPKDYTGSFGTNGFYLEFSDNSAATAATLGADTSGNGNNWTPNNLSVTAGAGNDSLVDTPTSYGTDTGAGGEVRGNYCTANPLDNGGIAIANGNLDLSTTSGSDLSIRGTFGIVSGKWYWEVTATNLVAGDHTNKVSVVGIAIVNSVLPSYVGSNATSWGYVNHNGTKVTNGAPASYGNSWVTNDVIGVALDADNGRLFFSKNGTWQASGDPAAGTNAAYTGLTSGPYAPAFGLKTSGASESINFGQRAFAYTAPSGFKALCDTNLPEGTITTSGTFTGNANVDGPFTYLNGVPTAMTINGNAVTFGTHADKLSNGFKVRNSTSTYNDSGSNTFSVSTTGAAFKFARAQPNP